MKAKLLNISTIMLTSAVALFAEDESTKEVNTIVDTSYAKNVIEKFSVSASVDYESEFIFRGKQLAGPVISPELDLAYDIGSGFSPYIGWWGCYSTNGGGYGENDLYAGVNYSIANFTIDFGYTAYTYSGAATYGFKNEHELKLMASYDTSEYLGDFAICPYIAAYYNITYEGKTIEGGFSYSAPITKWLVGENWASIDLAACAGYADYNGGLSDHGGYAYVGTSANISFAITDYWSISGGVRYSCNNDNDGGYAAIGGKENNVWVGVKTSIGF